MPAETVSPERLTELAAAMVAIPSVNPFGGSEGGAEADLAAFVAGRLADIGAVVDVREVASGRQNVYARLAGDGQGKTLMFAGHLDTVGVEGYADPFSPRLSGGKLFGRGACDMKGGLAAIIEAATVLAAAGAPRGGEVIVAALCDEEFAMLGSRAVGREGPHADMAIVAEPTGLIVCPAHKGQLGVVIRTLGRSAHSSMPELGENAIDSMARVLERLRSYDAVLRAAPPHPLCGRARFNVGVIAGGTVASIVPASCQVEVDRRTLPGETYHGVTAEIEAHLAPLREEGVRFEVEGPTWDIPPLDVSVDSTVVRLAGAAHEAATGSVARIDAFPAATDAPNLGCPAVVYGPGDLAVAHSADEWVEVEELATAARTYVEAALHLGD